MKPFQFFLPTLASLAPLAPLTTAQSPTSHTDPNSGITFSYFTGASGYFFGIALPPNSTTPTTNFIGTLGGQLTGWSGVSLGGDMLNKLLIVAWPNGEEIVASFRKTAQFGPPPQTTGSFTQTPIANGTYVNSTHWSYTFTCSQCVQGDGTTFAPGEMTPTLGWAVNAETAPAQKADPGSTVSKHGAQGQVVFDLGMARVR